MTQETPADRLRVSAAYIRDHWTTGVLCDENGLVCAVGALLGLRANRFANIEMGALLLDPIADVSVTLVADYLTVNVPRLRAHAGDGVRVALVETWNDDLARDGVEIAEVFEKVAAQWEEQHA